MKYEQPTFTVGQPSRVTACERCVYGRGRHADWCPDGAIELFRSHDKASQQSTLTRDQMATVLKMIYELRLNPQT